VFLLCLSRVLTLAALLLVATAAAQPSPLQRAAPRTVVLSGRPDESHDLRVAPGNLTTLRFDALILRDAVEVEGNARFDMDIGEKTLTVQPLAPLGLHESRMLRVSYRAGCPAFALFRLVADPSEVDTVITVSRPPQPPEACPSEQTSTRERCEAQGRELAQLKAQLQAISPAAGALAGWMNDSGMQVKTSPCKTGAGELHSENCFRMRGSTWAVVKLDPVTNTGKDPWAPTWAELTPTAGGKPRRARALLPLNRVISPGESVSIAVEVEMPPLNQRWLSQSYTLTLCDVTGRCLTVLDLKL
jgi:uncharacterized protein (TIGR02268 family)